MGGDGEKVDCKTMLARGGGDKKLDMKIYLSWKDNKMFKLKRVSLYFSNNVGIKW